ncbi:serine/threonine-protein kinase [Wenzhouxiangella marina]|uniref:Protein kinase domain-containing protein n=1 Tax=Wenzhouxiangella marina TaxID=1579979 RepID=A0A0K0XYC0_9GAMM|nr:serine/threonine-protein kinase [Wenzhouxiangella marina]AKS42689.1 hypothetical protein WM2015_2326 [Wenzhouxiangella marina]MBB6088622.1 serine/threonine-protein kinase [Wenzhouxiangella marina]
MGLDADSWQRVQAHFDRLSELAPDERAIEFGKLDLSEDDRRLLERLLDAHDDPDPLLGEQSAPELLDLDETPESLAIDWTGRRLGPWQVDRRIGQGGMSVVHLGHRADGRFDMQVAIKVLDLEQLGPSSSHRLDEEIRILARLEHPGIARLIDSGTADDGHPYLVMEFVDGLTLDRYADRNRLGLEARVDLVLQVARALNDAHQRQIIHCDIKPSNILVSGDGQARVVDFGIAALIRRHDGAASLDTHYCSPAHAAPERLAGALPTTRQDVFSLGSVLYRLLSGHPLRSERPGPATAQGFQAPSRRADPALPFAPARLRGDLDAICRKALAEDPSDRYGSMAELIADLEAWRDHRPVRARQGGRLYDLSRWLQRHTAAAVLGVLLLAALISGSLVSLDQARLARLEADRAVAARDFLVRILEAADPTREYGHDPTASELLRRGAEALTTDLADQPALRTELLLTVGRTQLERGLVEDASATLDRALASLEESPSHPAAAAILSSRGLAAYEQGDYQAAIDYLERARSAPNGPAPGSPDALGIAIQLADMYVVNAQPEPALNLIRPVLEAGPEPQQRAAALRVFGSALELSDRLEEAEATLRQAWALQHSIDPRHVDLAKIENDLGIVYWRMEDMDRAAEQFEASWRHKRDIYGQDHPQTLASLGNLAGVHSARRDHEAAERVWLDSLEGLARVHQGEAHPDIAYSYGMLALTLYWQDDYLAAENAMEEALRQREAITASDHAQVAWLDGLDALIQLELGQAIDPDRLGVDAAACANLGERRPLGQGLCLAWWSSVEPCPAAPLPIAEPALRGEWPRHWQQRWAQITQRCESPY